MLTERELLEIKERMIALGKEADGLQGQLTVLKQQLKDNWNLETIIDAKIALKDIETKRDKLKAEMNGLVAKVAEHDADIKEKYHL